MGDHAQLAEQQAQRGLADAFWVVQTSWQISDAPYLSRHLSSVWLVGAAQAAAGALGRHHLHAVQDPKRYGVRNSTNAGAVCRSLRNPTAAQNMP